MVTCPQLTGAVRERYRTRSFGGGEYMPIRRSALAAAALGTSLVATVCVAQSQSPLAEPAPLVHASADDCAVIVAIGKSELKWGAGAPRAAFLRDFVLPDRSTYREDCPWKELGVAEPTIGDAQSAAAFSITRPAYEGNRATAWFQYSVAELHEPSGTSIPPFLEREECTAQKGSAGWRLLGCRLAELR